jgi:tetratricopeptide (TPR) repeat protein
MFYKESMSKYITIFYLLFLIPSIAFSQSKKELKRASKLEKEGKQYLVGKMYKEAIVKFEESLKIYKKSTIYFNIAQAYRNIGDYKKALKYYKLFLPLITKVKKLSNKKKAEYIIIISGKIGEMEKKIIDEKELKDKLAAQKLEKIKAEKLAEKVKAEKQAAKIKVEEDKRKAEEEKKEAIANEKSLFRKWWFWTGVGSTVLFTGSAIYFGMSAVSANDEWEQSWNTSDRDSAKSFKLLSDLTAVGAVISAGTLALFSYFHYKKNQDDSSEKDTKSVNFTPVYTPDFYGFAFSLSF